MAKTKVAPDRTVGRNILSLMDASLTLPGQEALAKRIGVAQSTIGRIIRGEVNAAAVTLYKIADAYDLPVDALFLEAPAFEEFMLQNNRSRQVKVAGTERRKRAPLISWEQACHLVDAGDSVPSEVSRWLDLDDPSSSDESFALQISGDSMTAPPGVMPTFPDGTFIVVDPKKPVEAGNYVVAKDSATGQATFKRLTTDGGRWYLKPLNPVYPMIEIDDHRSRIIGKVVEYQMRGKL